MTKKEAIECKLKHDRYFSNGEMVVCHVKIKSLYKGLTLIYKHELFFFLVYKESKKVLVVILC